MHEIYMHFIIPLLWEIGIFIAIFAESIPFIGGFIPGGIIVLFLGGLFSRFGYLNIGVTLIVCFLASYSIDLFGYYLGKNKGRKLIHKYAKYFLIKRELVNKISALLRKHPTRISIISKFNPATRSIIGFTAGVSHVNFKKYRKVSMISSASWVIVFVGIGYLFGTGLESARMLGRIAAVVTFILLVGFYLLYLCRECWRKKLKKQKKSVKNGKRKSSR